MPSENGSDDDWQSEQRWWQAQCPRLVARTSPIPRLEVTIVNAISGLEMLPPTVFERTALVPQLKSWLGDRPSRPVTLFLDTAAAEALADNFEPAEEALTLRAAVADALSEEMRTEFMQQLQSSDRWYVCDVFGDFPAAAKDDPQIVLKAIEIDHECLQHASDKCKDEREIVIKAMQKSPACLRYAGKMCKDDKETVLMAVREDPSCLQYASNKCKGDREIVLRAIEEDPGGLRYAAEKCKDDKEIVLKAYRRHQDMVRARLRGVPLNMTPRYSCRG